MNTIARTDTSIVGRWWWTVDRWLLVMVASLAFFGAVLSLAASPAVAERIG
ncbi:MAG: cell division protein FtsW, partial [Rhodospirillales bacterium]|nr:cell division protein FtsW [Rhodospirillales bacterium]